MMVRVMKKLQNRKDGSALVLCRILLGIVCVLALCITGGTVYALLRGAVPGPDGDGEGAFETVFTGIGRIRVFTGGESPAAVILAVSFPYDPEDRFFAEELSARVGEFRRLSAGYFASLSAGELRGLDEGLVKAELLTRYNAALRLGSIGRLYFNEYMIIE
jgi:flagellar basal body-associated protein FliL